MQELKFKILEFVRLRGPVIPVQISKHIGSNILFAGAVLSELLANGKIKISTAKIGGSPVYYFPGQEPRLTMLYGHLHQREKHAYDLLRENKVLRDKVLQPVERVALREIKDFAYSFQYGEELFWRWYLLNEEEARNLVHQANQETPKQEIIEENKLEMKPEIQIVHPEIQQEINPREIKVESQERLQPQVKVEIGKEPQKPKLEKKRIKKEAKSRDDFVLMLKDYFDEKSIKVVEETIVKKNKEFDYIIEISSQIGNIRMFLSAKDKKKLNDADLSLAHNKSQLKKLPLMILTNGELTKQAREYVNNNYLIFERL